MAPDTNGTYTPNPGSKGRNIIVCFDGTTKEFCDKNTNIVKLQSMFDKEDQSKQVCYYQPGIGQYFETGAFSPLLAGGAQLLDWAFAWYMYQHVMDGYKFIMDNWNNGDRIYIFGFSRGAYVARCVAGMVEKIGLLAKDNHRMLTAAYNLYARTDAEGVLLSQGFKKSVSRDVKVDFVGVFDTVSSVGWILQRELPYASSNDGIVTFRHALALDERRFRFGPTHFSGAIRFPENDLITTGAWHVPAAFRDLLYWAYWKFKHPFEVGGFYAEAEYGDGRNVKIDTTDSRSYISKLRPVHERALKSAGIPVEALKCAGVPVEAAKKQKYMNGDHTSSKKSVEPKKDNVKPNVKEVWFVGGHEDIGGGTEHDNTTRSLSDITLRWMVGELMSVDAGIHVQWAPGSLEKLFGEEVVHTYYGSKDLPRGPLCAPELDRLDASAPIHDDLALQPGPIFGLGVPKGWWGLEVLPLSSTWEDITGLWYRQWRINFGRGRILPEGAMLHRSVYDRISDRTLRYTPWARGNSREEVVWSQNLAST